MTMSENTEKRETLATRLGFILLSAGCAIGLGNVWRFPFVAGKCGGGWFVVLYLVFLAILGVPVLMMEFAVGRAARRSLARAHAQLTPGKRAWGLHGVAGILGNVTLMMFYTTVTGWMFIYFRRMLTGAFAGADSQAIGAAFGGMLADPWGQTGAMLLVSMGAVAVCAIGLRKGLERVSKWIMLCLMILILALAVNSLSLEGAWKGVRFLLVPDTERLMATGFVKVCVEAMNHAFFTLSLGIGAMAIFGSYIGKDRTLLSEALHVAGLDTFVALTSGLIVLPACFAFGVEPGQGPGLVFVTLPNIFNHMAGGRLWGALFFLFMSCAAFTTVLAVFETILAGWCDYTGWSRRKTSLFLAVAIPLLSMPCVLGFNRWSGFHPFGAGSNVLDLEDFIVSNLLLPLGGLAFAVYCCHRIGWGWEAFRREVNAGAGPKFPERFVRGYCTWVLPIVIFAVFALGVWDKFRP